MTEELKKLRDLYIADLSKIVKYGTNPPRPRIRNPEKWAKLKTCIRLNEQVGQPITIPTLEDRKVWVWSDLHWMHKNIINFSKRPFINTREMDQALIDNFNEYVGEDDISIWVGDIGFKGTLFINEYLDQCKGYKILVVGNHDFDGKKIRRLSFDETHLIYHIHWPFGHQVDLVFTHYPMHNIPWPYFNIHGHLHAYPISSTGNPLHFNANCELHNYRPVELDEIIRVARMRVIATKM